MYAVELDNITKRFGDHVAVDDLTLRVPKGTIYGFIGPNGSGKTTTLRMVMRILYPNSGSIRVLGEDVLGKGAVSDRVGYLPEERGLYKKMKIKDALRFYADLKNTPNAKSAVDWWLERMGLQDWADKRVEALSKGMAQKAQFIGAVICRPELIILDEPFTGLDPVNTDVIREVVLELKRDGATIIFSTHDMLMAEKMCDYIFMIFKGRKVLDGTLDEIQSAYGTDTLRVRVDANGKPLDTLPGVQKVTDFGKYQELRIENGVDTQTVLADLMARGRVDHFELARPSLHDIFVRIAGPEAEEASHA
ncbi:MAG: ATP-binding cassette domain-containing protein [Planctomycetes bacterium]|nr:ATP-binding cassette domain-containing protein [Planctomycetota bacterium]